MVKALGRRRDGKLSLILGLSDINLEKLKEGNALLVNLDEIPFPANERSIDDLHITIIYGKDELEIAEALKSLMLTNQGTN